MDRFEVREAAELAPQQAEQVLAIAQSALTHDGVEPLNEHTLLHLRHHDRSIRHLLALTEGRLAGYAFLDGSAAGATQAECVVAPLERGAGLGRALVQAGLRLSLDRPLTIWAHGDLPAAAALAGSTGLHRIRELRLMTRQLSDPLPPAAPPDGVVVRTFRPGLDDDAWVELNGRAFANHPEQGRVTVADLRARQAQPWFDPDGFFLAERHGRLVGFHWTKVHADRSAAVGEVYVVGVAPEAQGGGLGRALTLHGLHHLQAAGLGSVQLYVEADNAPALQVYARLGFAVAGVDVQYSS